jgi:hypothetical protein
MGAEWVEMSIKIGLRIVAQSRAILGEMSASGDNQTDALHSYL